MLMKCGVCWTYSCCINVNEVWCLLNIQLHYGVLLSHSLQQHILKIFCIIGSNKYRVYSRNSRTFLTKILYLNLGCVIYARKRFYINKSGYTGNFF